MNRKKTLSILAVVLMMACCFSMGANASGALQEIKAYLNSGITITMDGEAQTFLNEQGVRVYPITYQGSTYLPVRAVAGLVGLDVEWDQATQTVKLGKTKGVDLIDAYNAYDLSSNIDFKATQVQSSEKKTQEISGVSCSHWLHFWIRGAFIDAGTTCSASFNLLGQHETMTFQYYTDRVTTLRVLGDNGFVLFESSVPGGQVAQTATVPLMNTSQLTFQIEKPDGENTTTDAYIFNVHLDAED